MKHPDAMTDNELVDASFTLEQMYTDVIAKRENPKFIAKFPNQSLPPINPYFLETRINVTAEIEKRKGQ